MLPGGEPQRRASYLIQPEVVAIGCDLLRQRDWRGAVECDTERDAVRSGRCGGNRRSCGYLAGALDYQPWDEIGGGIGVAPTQVEERVAPKAPTGLDAIKALLTPHESAEPSLSEVGYQLWGAHARTCGSGCSAHQARRAA